MTRRWTAAAALIALTFSAAAGAEPYFAVRQGLKCIACHVNPTGGGMRNTFGETWSQRILPAQAVDTGGFDWTGQLTNHVSLGGNFRASGTYTDIPHQDSTSEFAVDEARLYLMLDPIPNRFQIYFDEQIAPGGAGNLEAWAMLWLGGQRAYIKAGQFYLPYGLRLEDDTAYVRQVPGINMTTPDRGVEFGWETVHLSAQLAISNGAAGGSETDNGKQVTAKAEYVASAWRAGISGSFNDLAAGNRKMAGLYTGLRTGPIAWLAEADYVSDETLGTSGVDAWVGLVEANWNFAPGQNLKLTAEYYDPNVDVKEDGQNRWSAVWEYVPMQFVQLRVGLRAYDGIPQNDLQNRTVGFIQLNAYF